MYCLKSQGCLTNKQKHQHGKKTQTPTGFMPSTAPVVFNSLFIRTVQNSVLPAVNSKMKQSLLWSPHPLLPLEYLAHTLLCSRCCPQALLTLQSTQGPQHSAQALALASLIYNSSHFLLTLLLSFRFIFALRSDFWHPALSLLNLIYRFWRDSMISN